MELGLLNEFKVIRRLSGYHGAAGSIGIIAYDPSF